MKRLMSFLVMCIMGIFLPQMADAGAYGVKRMDKELVNLMVPAFLCAGEAQKTEDDLLARAEYENRTAAGAQKDADEKDADKGQERDIAASGGTAADAAGWAPEEALSGDAAVGASAPEGEDAPETAEVFEGAHALEPEETEEGEETPVVTWNVPPEKLNDFDYLIQNYYVVDSSTTIRSGDICAEELLAKDLSVNLTADGPQILIYHTHSQEGFADSEEGDASTSVVALGEYLAGLLAQQYGFRVLHHTGEYDVDDRDHAYSNAAPNIKKLLEENPTIEVVIDLHRDSVPEDRHLVTDINGKGTAKIMFFNGLCRTTARGDLSGLPNPYLQDNLAFSLQMQVAAAKKYPDFTRKIYLKGYRYNMHLCPRSLLVEVGAQNNTFEEGKNAMEPLADLLAEVLK